MNLGAKITLWISNFFKKYGQIIFIAFFAWLIIFLINRLIAENPAKPEISNTYSPDSPVIDDTSSISKSTANDINETIKEYFDYCNDKNYEKAYEFLTDDSKRYLYNDDITNFQKYIDGIFTSKKVYSVQNYSNVDKVYIYDLTISDDFEATGSTGANTTGDKVNTYQEKIAVKKVGDSYKISNNNFIETDEINRYKEDQYMQVTVKSKDVSYSLEGYNLTIQNKTDGYIVISDFSLSNEVQLNLENQLRSALNLANGQFYVGPGETKDLSFIFRKYYDDGNTPTEIRLNSVRILKDYLKVNEQDTQDTSKNAYDMYSFNIELE